MRVVFSSEASTRKFYRSAVILPLFIAIFLAYSHAIPSDAVPNAEAESSPLRYRRNEAFTVPEKLRARVNFWKDIFAKYGKAQFVIHHRWFPQIVFMEVDLKQQFESMDPISFEKYKKATEKRTVREVESAIQFLAKDQQPETALQRHISSQMQWLGPGTAKYKTIIKEELIRTQTGIKEKFAQSIQRSGRYLPLIEKIFVEDNSLPVELTRLPFIESSFDYTAYSSVGAAGIWQFMPRTAKLYMTVNQVIDERRDPLEASKGAAKYLRDAYSRLGKWPLAITSYNHGVAGVARKVAAAGTSDITELIEHPTEQAFGFASSNFYPEFLAAIELHDDYHRYFPKLEIEPPIHAREVVIPRAISARSMAQQLNVQIEDLKELNYAVSKHVWSGRYNLPAGYRLKVPHETGLHLAYLKGESRLPPPEVRAASSIYGGTTYKVRKGDTLLSIGKKYGTSVSTLKQLNGLSSSSIRVGQSLTVTPRDRGSSNSTSVASVPHRTTTHSSTKTKTHKVRSGDSLWSLSIKYKVSIDDIRRANKGVIVGDKLTGGKTITIPQ